MKRFLLSSTQNTRDLGGYSTKSGIITVYNAFLRSDVPHEATKEDIELLLSNHINTIVDLRNNEEVQRKPCAFKNAANLEYYHCKLHGDGWLPESAEAVPDSYMEMVIEQKSVCNVMKIFANAKGGILYHCSAGKDRTGVISALLLLLAEVQESDIIDDYRISYVYLESMLKQYCKTNEGVDLNIVTPKAEYMKNFIIKFLKKYGSVKKYLELIGLSDIEIRSIQCKLTGGQL